MPNTAHVMRAAARTLRAAALELPDDAPRSRIRRRAAKLAHVQAIMGRSTASRRIGAEAADRHNMIAHILETRGR
ncbi:MAG: hypothetical protein OXG35_13275 [Acidobacteria bacterium]|nr:hypothetical protein [Acidobacteriota bacterium]